MCHLVLEPDIGLSSPPVTLCERKTMSLPPRPHKRLETAQAKEGGPQGVRRAFQSTSGGPGCPIPPHQPNTVPVLDSSAGWCAVGWIMWDEKTGRFHAAGAPAAPRRAAEQVVPDVI